MDNENRKVKKRQKRRSQESKNGHINWDKYLQDLSSSSDDTTAKKIETKSNRPRLFNRTSIIQPEFADIVRLPYSSTPFNHAPTENIEDYSKLSPILPATNQAAELEVPDDRQGTSEINFKGKEIRNAENINKHIAAPPKKCKHSLCRKELFCRQASGIATSPVKSISKKVR